jgi:hypothetical protein
MITLLELTNSNAIRAAIGVDEASGELDDHVFEDLRLADMLRLELATWLPKSIEDLQDEALAASDPADRAALGLTALQSAATYWCAASLLLTAEISFAVRQEDGQNRSVRKNFDQSDLYEKLMARYNYFRGMVTDLLAPDAPSSIVNWFAGKATPDYDPVTNT